MILEELVMKKSYGVNELRRMYLDFFESKGHLVMKSFSDRKSTRLNSSHPSRSRMPSSA